MSQTIFISKLFYHIPDASFTISCTFEHGSHKGFVIWNHCCPVTHTAKLSSAFCNGLNF